MTIRAYDHFIHTGSDYPGLALMENFHSIIKQCLVNGTGGVPGAGWNLEYDEGELLGTFVLSNGDRDFFICFCRTGSSTVQVSISASFEGVDENGLILGEAARSGRSPGISGASAFNIPYLVGNSTAHDGRGGWAILADADTCSFVYSAATNRYVGPAMDATSSTIRRYGGGFSFGKTTKSFGYVSGLGGNGYFCHPADGLTVLNYPQTGLLIPSIDTVPPVSAGFLGHGNAAAANTAPFTYEDQLMLPLEVYMGGSVRGGTGSLGRIRGFVQLPFVDKSLFPRHLLNALSMAEDDFDTMRVQDLSKFRIGSDGFRYAYGKLANGDTSLAQIFLTDNPMVW